MARLLQVGQRGWLRKCARLGVPRCDQGDQGSRAKCINLQSPLQDTSGVSDAVNLFEAIIVCKDFTVAFTAIIRPCNAILHLLAFDTASAPIFVVLELLKGLSLQLGVLLFSARLPGSQKFPANDGDAGK